MNKSKNTDLTDEKQRDAFLIAGVIVYFSPENVPPSEKLRDDLCMISDKYNFHPSDPNTDSEFYEAVIRYKDEIETSEQASTRAKFLFKRLYNITV